MKKLFLLLSFTLLLVGCSNGLTKEDLQANAWITNLTELAPQFEGQANAELTFHENSIDLAVNVDDIWEIYVKENPEDDNEFAKAIITQLFQSVINQSLPYTLENDVIKTTLTIPDSETIDFVFNAEKDEDNIILTINEEEMETNPDTEFGQLTLIPK